MKHVLELALLELEVFLFKCGLFARLSGGLRLTTGYSRGTLQHKALVYIRDKVVIQVLGMILFNLIVSSLLVVGDHRS